MARRLYEDGLGNGFMVGVLVVAGIVAAIAFTKHELDQQRHINSLRYDMARMRVVADHADKVYDAIYPTKCDRAEYGTAWVTCKPSDRPAWEEKNRAK